MILSLKSLAFISLLSITTFTAAFLYVLHFILKVELKDFILTMLNRFGARTSLNLIGTLYHLTLNYVQSFGNILVLILILFILIAYLKKFNLFKERLKTNREIIIIIFVLSLENFFLNNHAISYSFARLKSVLLLIIILVIMLSVVKEKYNHFSLKAYYFLNFLLITAVLLSSFVSINFYTRGNHYRWQVDYLKSNREIANSLSLEFN